MKEFKDTRLNLKTKHIESVLEQMRTNGLCYDDFWAEYNDGTNTTYSWDQDAKEYIVTKIDIIVGSFFKIEPIADKELKKILLEKANIKDLKNQGFKLTF